MAVSDSAIHNLGQFIMNTTQPPMQSPEKMAGMDDIMQKMFNGMPIFAGMNQTRPMPPPSMDQKPSVSSGSQSPRNDSPASDEQPQDVNTTGTNKEPRNYRMEPWHECFTTTSAAEYEALIYSVYVIDRDDKKLDGFDYYECINRLQSKCRYRIRAKKMNEFFIVEEKGAHNHAMEPVGSPGSHAGLPKTLREIVDLSFREDWTHAQRQGKLDEEVRRLGLPHNPRLNRQVDNRIAYLRRVKNLSEMRKLQDQIPGLPSMSSASMMPAGPPTSETNGNVAGGTPDDILRMMMQMANNPEAGQDPSRLLQMMMASGVPPPVDMHQINGNMEQQQMQMKTEPAENPQVEVEESTRSTPEGRLKIDDNPMQQQ